MNPQDFHSLDQPRLLADVRATVLDIFSIFRELVMFCGLIVPYLMLRDVMESPELEGIHNFAFDLARHPALSWAVIAMAGIAFVAASTKTALPAAASWLTCLALLASGSYGAAGIAFCLACLATTLYVCGFIKAGHVPPILRLRTIFLASLQEPETR